MTNNTREVQVNDIVQVVPEHKWCGSLVVVTEVKEWGIQGFVQIPMEGQAYIRLNKDEYELVGMAAFIPDYVEDEDENN